MREARVYHRPSVELGSDFNKSNKLISGIDSCEVESIVSFHGLPQLQLQYF